VGTLGTSFGAAAGDYSKGRPGYPADAVAWVLKDVTEAVADVGAGTGKLTAEIVRQGFAVTAIDPDADMLAALAAELPQVPSAVGTAEAIPLANESVGAVTFGQAWHWVDVVAASAEAARVLKPGGVLGLIWNVRDESVDWVLALGKAMGSSRAESMIDSDDVHVAEPFSELEERVSRWELLMAPDQVRAMVRSRSYYIAGDPDFRARVDRDVDAVLTELNSDAIAMPYVTHAFRALRP
jgi:SAM-dependent methyltransferase